MSENSKIEWTDHTFNPFIGCSKVSPGCDHCYAEHMMDTRLHKVVWGPHGERVRTSDATWREPIRWNARHDQFFAVHGRRQRVFCASLADVFDNAVDPSWRVDLFRLIAKTPHLDWLLLTKRIGNARAMLNEVVDELSRGLNTWDELPWPGVWIGATIVHQAEADRDIEKLLMTPARRRFLSMEPLLGPVDLRAWFDPTGVCCMQEMSSCEDCPADAPWIHGPTTEYAEDGTGYSSPEIDWVIVGGESGHGARPMHPEWARDLRDQCAAYGVPFLFKQWGEWAPGSGDFGAGRFETAAIARDGRVAPGGYRVEDYPRGSASGDGWAMVHRAGKRVAGRHLDGRTHDDFPRALT
ncbi:phage Gp37/Gp68 family protein [Burkholderia sp. AU32262]|uniref:phage Gp37/Gp68 family protein n=1 Tax=Burkholderia sp. AU32262 TaxID=2879630 RepID=UPI001CF4E8BE|nr:phage Gp37/Gp68 family protein [Burkholderia sp. AU32262]MCA8242890.1 phage Gp37/Gp68 family protein [Burkholderia sp. AU32262]